MSECGHKLTRVKQGNGSRAQRFQIFTRCCRGARSDRQERHRCHNATHIEGPQQLLMQVQRRCVNSTTVTGLRKW